MTWNYRLIQHEEEFIGLHEVYYREDGTISSWTDEPVSFGGTNQTEVIRQLYLALADVRKYPILHLSELSASKADLLDTGTKLGA